MQYLINEILLTEIKMKVQCSKCESIYNIDYNKIPDNGAFVVCVKCKARFVAKKPLVNKNLNSVSSELSDSCPFCAENIESGTLECSYCGKWLGGKDIGNGSEMEEAEYIDPSEFIVEQEDRKAAEEDHFMQKINVLTDSKIGKLNNKHWAYLTRKSSIKSLLASIFMGLICIFVLYDWVPNLLPKPNNEHINLRPEKREAQEFAKRFLDDFEQKFKKKHLFYTKERAKLFVLLFCILLSCMLICSVLLFFMIIFKIWIKNENYLSKWHMRQHYKSIQLNEVHF